MRIQVAGLSFPRGNSFVVVLYTVKPESPSGVAQIASECRRKIAPRLPVARVGDGHPEELARHTAGFVPAVPERKRRRVASPLGILLSITAQTSGNDG